MKQLLNLIGNTPLLEIESGLFAKLEGVNLTGSIKDRTALAMIEDAEKKGVLKKGDKIIESSSGNTAIALAMISAVKGYSFSAVIPQSTSEEKKKMILTYGASIILIPDKDYKRDSIIEGLKLQAKETSAVYLNQYENLNNVAIHYNTTGKEIIDQLKVTPDYFVVGLGTGGTATGISKKLKERYSNIKIIGIEPKLNHKIEGLRSTKFYTPPILDLNLIDEIIELEEEDSIKGRNYLAKMGILVGLSSGAVYQAIKNLNLKGNIVTIFPDRGERYLK